jgi:hypothetical protein
MVSINHYCLLISLTGFCAEGMYSPKLFSLSVLISLV